MNETTITAEMGADGILRQRGPDGTTEILTQQQPEHWDDADILADAQSDPDVQPLTPEELVRMRRVSAAQTLRRTLGLTQEEFAARYAIPLGTLRDWEQGRTEPDAPARAYLRAIAGDPAAVQRALDAAPRRPA